MRKLLFVGGLVLLTLSLAVIGCEKAASDYLSNADCTGVSTDNTYTNTVKAILDANCASSGCHNASSKRDGIDLSTYSAAKNAIANTACLCSIYHDSGCTPMPEGASKLSDSDIQKIVCWASNGYPE